MWRFVGLAAYCLALLHVGAADDGFAKKSADEYKVNCNDTDTQKFTLDEKHEFVYINCQNDASKWSRLEVLVDTKLTGALAIEFKSLTLNSSTDSFRIYKDENSTQLHDGIPNEGVWMPTDQTKLLVQVARGPNSSGTVSIKIHSKCAAVIGADEFRSPALPNKYSANATVECVFNRTEPSVFNFHNVSLSKGSQIEFIRGVEAPFMGPYTADKPLNHVIIGKLNAAISLKFKLTENNQTVEFTSTLISRDICGEPMLDLAKDVKPIKVSGDVKNGKETTCVWLVSAPPKQMIRVQADKHTFKYSNDLLSVIDSGYLAGEPILQVTAMTRNTEAVMSSGQYVLISFTSSNFNDANEQLEISLSAISSGGRASGSGNISFTGSSSEWWLTAADEKNKDALSVQVDFGMLILKDGEKLAVYSDFASKDALLTFENGRIPTFPIASPGQQLRVVATGFERRTTDEAKVDFSTIPQGSGCYRTFVDGHGSDMRVGNDCIDQATWIIRPQTNQPNIYFKVAPNSVKSATIVQLLNNKDVVQVSGSSDTFMIAYKTTDGAKVNLDCQSTGECQSFVMSYSTGSVPPQTQVIVSGSQNITLTSPFFPGPYPFGGEFPYTINQTNSKVTKYLATAHVLDLLEGQSLSFSNGSSSIQFNGKKTPGDFILSADSLKKVVFDTNKNLRVNPKGAYGFHFDLMAIDPDSNTLTDSKANITLGNDKDKCKDIPCIYIIDIPKPKEDGSSFSVNITVSVVKKNSTINSGSLLVWDGNSTLRDPLLPSPANLSTGGSFYSRSNKVIIRYQGTPMVEMSYVQSPCSYAEDNMCKTSRMCMPPEWRCNGHLDCPDGSDEFECNGREPPHPTPPGPSGGSSHGWRNAFWICMPIFIALGVLLTMGTPRVLQKLRDSRYQQFHDLGDH